MTLKEKFKIINCTDCDMPYCDIKCTTLAPYELDKLEKIADEFAIDFLKWVVSPETRDLLSDLEIVGEIDQFVTPEQLLEIYKKEKGL